MTGAEELPIYPAYCFQLSPTINQFCPLRSADIQRLECHPGFAGQDVFFHLNHPIKWVRIAGVVIAVDDYAQRRIYTVDDSSGVCIECLDTISTPDPPHSPLGVDAGRQEPDSSVKVPAPACAGREALGVSCSDGVDVGTVVDIKGGLGLFRGNKQVKIEKMSALRSTEQELHVWDKSRQFRDDVLSRPWKLSDKDVRRCQRQAEGADEAAERRHKKNNKKIKEQDRLAQREATGPSISLDECQEPKASVSIRAALENRATAADQMPVSEIRMPTGLEKLAKVKETPIHIRGHYSALGL